MVAALSFLKPASFPRVVDDAEQALVDNRENRIYQRGNTLVRVVEQREISMHNKERWSGGMGVLAVDPCYLVEELTRVADWQKYSAREKDYVHINAPMEVAKTLLARRQYRLPNIRAVINAPTIARMARFCKRPVRSRDGDFIRALRF